MYKFNPHAIAPLLLAISVFSLASFVYLKNRKSEINKTFGLFSFCYVIVMFGTFMMFISKDEKLVMYWDRLIYIGAILGPAAWYHFVVAFANIKSRKKFIKINYIISLIFLLLSRTKYFVDGVYSYSWGYHSQARILHNIFLIYFSFVLARGIHDLYKVYKQPKTPLQQNQLKYLSIGISIAGFTGIGLLSAYNVSIYPLVYQACGLIFVIIITYAIVKYRLMDIAVVVTRTSIFVVLFSLVLGLPFLLASLAKEWLMKYLGMNWWLGPVALMAALGISGPFIFFYIEKRAVSMLLREQRRYQEILRHAAVDMTRIRNLQKLLDFIISLFNDAVRITHSAIYLFDAKTEEFFLKAGLNIQKEQPDLISKRSSLITWLEEHKESLVYEEIKQISEDEANSIFKKLEQEMLSLNATVVVPCILEDKLLDILILGDKLSGKIYSSEDLNNFLDLGREVALATENALLYENIEGEVRQRTKQLIEVQSQLVQAEKLATVGTLAGGVAHEINNPLTAILTNAQMLLADAKSFDTDSKESLQLIEEATQRCRSIVQKLMTYAKRPLETTEVSRVDLLNVAKKVISFLGYQFEQENIKIIFKAKEGEYLVNGNQNELEQVFTNIILNAKDAIKRIKKSSTIDISLLKEENWIKIDIRDEGVGISKEIMPKIFDPFFTTKEVGEGLGLGLSICQSIVEKHSGSITVQSEVDKGSVFTVRFPRIKEV